MSKRGKEIKRWRFDLAVLSVKGDGQHDFVADPDSAGMSGNPHHFPCKYECGCIKFSVPSAGGTGGSHAPNGLDIHGKCPKNRATKKWQKHWKKRVVGWEAP